MPSKISVAFASLFTLASATSLPTTLTISVVNSAGAILGTLNGYGNFSSPGPSYLFRAFPSTGHYSTLDGYGTCIVDGVLDCEGNGDATDQFTASFDYIL